MKKYLSKFPIKLVAFSFIFALLACESQEEKSAKLKIEKQKLGIFRLAQAEFEKTQVTVKTGEIKRGQGFFQALNAVEINRPDSLSVINKLRDKVEFSKLKVGDKLTATFNVKKELVQFSFSNSPAEKHVLTTVNTSHKKEWNYKFIEEETFWKTRYITGKLKAGSTLQYDLVSEGLKRSTVGEIINILLCKVHFRSDARMGDNYEVLLRERLFNGKILESKILYTSYSGKKAGNSNAYFYDDGDKKSIYSAHYTEDGEALIRSGLRYPVKRLHIRSGYGKRRHPVTGRRTMHRGVDLRGRTGAPVYAVARGIVVESKMTPIGGNKVAIRHSDNSKSYYLHLHKRFVKVGTRVKAHQVIGQIGSTGRVTGPHLHFGFKKSNGRWMNPMHKRMIATPKLKGIKLANLKEQIIHTKNILKNLPVKKVSENRLPATQHNEI